MADERKFTRKTIENAIIRNSAYYDSRTLSTCSNERIVHLYNTFVAVQPKHKLDFDAIS